MVVFGGVLVAVVAFLGGAVAERSIAASPSDEATRRQVVAVRRAPHVVVYGDSLVVQAEPYLDPVGSALGARVSSRTAGGIAPCDALESLADDLEQSTPDIVVFAFSGNSLSDCMRRDNGTLATGDDLLATYREDLELAIRMATSAGAPFVLASPPASERAPDEWQPIDALYREIAALHGPYVQYVDAGLDIAPGGRFVPMQRCLPFELRLAPGDDACGAADPTISVRAGDGVHFCGDVVQGTAGTCATYSSGALRYAVALVTAAKLDLDYVNSLDDIGPSRLG